MSEITSAIVQVNVQVVEAPEPSALQQSGAFISVGGTTQMVSTFSYLPASSSLSMLLSTVGNHAELVTMNNTFFAQGGDVGAYVLELGVQGSAADGINALNSWIQENPDKFYVYLDPATWDTAGATLETVAGDYASATGETYFIQTTTSETIDAYTAKSILTMVESPTAPGTEFTAASLFYQVLVNAPSSAFPFGPLAYRYLFGVTPWPATGYQSTIDDILSAFGNIVLTGAEGGISNACLFKGTTMDGNQFGFWYSVDWFDINAHQQLAAAVINGANTNPPLVYNQNGINTLEGVANNEVTNGVAFQLLLNGTVTAIPFGTYTTQNPDNYDAGLYGGLAASITPQLGFLTIVFNITATQLASGS